MTHILSVIRSRDISVNIMIQSLTQLESMYGPQKSQTILDNCDNLLYMGCNSSQTAEYIGTRASRTPDNILNGLSNQKAWYIPSGEKARLVDKIMAGTYHVPAIADNGGFRLDEPKRASGAEDVAEADALDEFEDFGVFDDLPFN